MPPFLLGTFIQVNGLQLTNIYELHFLSLLSFEEALNNRYFAAPVS